MKFVILLFAIILSSLNVNAQRDVYVGETIDVVGEITDRPRRDGNQRGGSDRDSSGSNRSSNTKQVEVNGKSFKVSKEAKKELKSFLAEFNLMQDVGKFVPGNGWGKATKAKAEKFIKEQRFNAAKRNNRGDEKMWEAVLDGLRKSGHLNNEVNSSVERKIRKERERTRERANRRSGGGDNRP